MASEWAEEADRQARAVTRDLAEVGRKRGFRVEYQKREARFALRAGNSMSYFSAHDYQGPKGMDWLRQNRHPHTSQGWRLTNRR